MAATKKTVATTATTKVEEPKTESKKTVTPVTTTVKTETVKATVKPAETVKKEEVKAEKVEKAETVKKAAVKKETAAKAPAKKAELKNEIHIQFGGNSYSQEDLIKIAKDVWKYDLKQKAGDLTSVELYVKPEEHMVYYVMNKEITGSFYI